MLIPNSAIIEICATKPNEDDEDNKPKISLRTLNKVMDMLSEDEFLAVELAAQKALTSFAFNCTRKRLGLPETPKLCCPDCQTEMVKTFVEHDDGSGWMGCWACDCKPEPGVIDINKE